MNSLGDIGKNLIFAGRKENNIRIMETKKITFTAKPGTFRDAVRAYRQYKKEKEEFLKQKLQHLEEEIEKAKSDSFFKIETV